MFIFLMPCDILGFAFLTHRSGTVFVLRHRICTLFHPLFGVFFFLQVASFGWLGGSSMCTQTTSSGISENLERLATRSLEVKANVSSQINSHSVCKQVAFPTRNAQITLCILVRISERLSYYDKSVHVQTY